MIEMKQRMSTKWLAFLLMGFATILFSLGSPSLKFLIERADAVGFSHPDAVSFCNVLFIGNFCAGIIAAFFVVRKTFVAELAALSSKSWCLLILSCVLAAVYPALIFIALEHTTVVHLVLVSRFEGVAYLLCAYLFLGVRITRPVAVGYVFIVLGVLMTLFASHDMFGIVDLLILSACCVYGVSEVLTLRLTQFLSTTHFLFLRNITSAIIFFIIALCLFGPEHFMSAFYGDLWVALFLYAAFAIIFGQLMWFKAADKVPASWPADFAMFIPFFSIGFAYFLLGTVPPFIELVAMFIIAVGILMAKLFDTLANRTRTLCIDTGLIGR